MISLCWHNFPPSSNQAIKHFLSWIQLLMSPVSSTQLQLPAVAMGLAIAENKAFCAWRRLIAKITTCKAKNPASSELVWTALCVFNSEVQSPQNSCLSEKYNMVKHPQNRFLKMTHTPYSCKLSNRKEEPQWASGRRKSPALSFLPGAKGTDPSLTRPLL